MPEWFDELASFLKIPSVSADPERSADVLAAADWVVDFIVGAGGSAERIDWHGSPLAVGEIRASTDADRARTVLCYGHFDVQPAEPLELWESDPFTLTERDIHLYGRGVADDKGQLYLLLAAARELARSGQLPVNVRFACDGEEETGGHAIVEYIGSLDEVGADAAVIFDSGMISADMPSFDIAMRGLCYMHLTLTTGTGDLHSGIYGGAAMNAAAALIRTLDALIAREGRVPEELRQGIVEPTAEELEGWRALPAGVDELAAQGATPMDELAAEEFYRRTFAETTFEVNGIQSGSPMLEKTVLPVEAVANVSLRLPAGQDPQVIAQVAERLLMEAVPKGATLTVEHLSSADAGMVAPDSPAVHLAQDAFESVLGVRPVLVRSGGTIPMVAALANRDVPTIITGFTLPDCAMHAPNERFRTDHIPKGIATAKALFEHLARLPEA